MSTGGRIANGAIIEKEVGFELGAMQNVKISLRNPDFTTAKRIAEGVNSFAQGSVAKALDPHTVEIEIPVAYRGKTTGFTNELKNFRIFHFFFQFFITKPFLSSHLNSRGLSFPFSSSNGLPNGTFISASCAFRQ